MRHFILLCFFVLAAGYAVSQPFGSAPPSSGGGSGTVTSAGFTMDGVLFNSSVTGSPITTSGTFAPTLANAAQNSIWGGPPTGGAGAPSYQLVPTFNGTNIWGVIPTNNAQLNYEPVYTGPGTGINGITWFPATNVDIVTTAIRTNFINSQLYTNNTGSLIFLIGSTTNVDGGVISTGANTFTIAVSNTGYAAWSNYNTGGNVVATSIAGLLETNTFNVPVDTNGVYMLSTTASGSGNSSGLIPGTGQIVTIGNATASGVPSLGGNNTFTGNQTFNGGSSSYTSTTGTNTETSTNSSYQLNIPSTSVSGWPVTITGTFTNNSSNYYQTFVFDGVATGSAQNTISNAWFTAGLAGLTIGAGTNLAETICNLRFQGNTATANSSLAFGFSLLATNFQASIGALASTGTFIGTTPSATSSKANSTGWSYIWSSASGMHFTGGGEIQISW